MAKKKVEEKPAKKTTKSKEPAKKAKPVSSKKDLAARIAKTKKADKKAEQKKVPKGNLSGSGTHKITFKKNAKTLAKKGNWSLSDFKAADYNPRNITAKELSNLGQSIAEFGDLSGVVFNRFSGQLVSGHQRISSLSKYPSKIETSAVKGDKHGTVEEGYIVFKTEKGLVRIPLRIVEWDSLKTEGAANIAANAHGGDFDTKRLALLVGEIGGFGPESDPNLLGLGEEQLKSLKSFTAPTEAGSSSAKSFQEFDADEVQQEMDCKCPQCGFLFKKA